MHGKNCIAIHRYNKTVFFSCCSWLLLMMMRFTSFSLSHHHGRCCGLPYNNFSPTHEICQYGKRGMLILAIYKTHFPASRGRTQQTTHSMTTAASLFSGDQTKNYVRQAQRIYHTKTLTTSKIPINSNGTSSLFRYY